MKKGIFLLTACFLIGCILWLMPGEARATDIDDDYIELDMCEEPSATGWQYFPNGVWQYVIDEEGHLPNGWYKIDGKWWYFNEIGIMQTGWKKVDGKWWYLNNYMRTGWQYIDGKWWYLKNYMLTGWQYINGKWYYLNNYMVTGRQEIDGKVYYFDSNGAWIPD